MISHIRRVYVEKKLEFNVESERLLTELKETLGIIGLENIRIINRYDFMAEDNIYDQIKGLILSEPNVDLVYDDDLPKKTDERILAIQYLPGQYDQRADSAQQCIQILVENQDLKVKVAKVILLKGKISGNDFSKIKNYCINSVDSREADLGLPQNLVDDFEDPQPIKIVNGFINFNQTKLAEFKDTMGFAMSYEDICFVKEYFAVSEERDPTITELKVIDTYWSDHCRHTTFFTEIQDIQVEDGLYKDVVENTLKEYVSSREYIQTKKPITLMDLATVNGKQCRKMGLLPDLDISDEINACSIEIDVDKNGTNEKWLLMFKNETHNHPTEIEPFGGAATCLGGAIRDPLSGRSYVYQAMRITGSGDPRKSIQDTLPGKLSQRKISREAARGFSSYGNQIGLATGQVVEIYHEGYVAKRMEVGAVVGATPRENVYRKVPVEGDVILLIGGRTGRDGCGGATGSSKVHTEDSLSLCGAEVQKGNPPEERKIQRLFRKPEVTKCIKKCNDFGAGGVSVAIGELADSLEINLDSIPKKYEGLDGTELAISESQERIAVVVESKDVEKFIAYGNEENLEVTEVAKVTATGRLVMKWRNQVILDLSRDFLDTNGAKQYANVVITSPNKLKTEVGVKRFSYKDKVIAMLQDLNICSQQGLGEMFDSTIGAGTVTMPYGGKYALTPAEGMAGKIPVLEGDTNTCSLMTYGYDPELCEWSPYHGGIYSIVECVSKIVAMGGDYKEIRLSMQEYFERLGNDPKKWGKPFSALLGAYHAQSKLGIAAIGGKDSMSGTFKDLTVPPTIIAFGVAVDKTENILSPEFKKTNSVVYLLDIPKDKNCIPDFSKMKEGYEKIKKLIDQDEVLSAKTVLKGGVVVAISKMNFGNKIGFVFDKNIDDKLIFSENIGSIILEVDKNSKVDLTNFIRLGVTTSEPILQIGNEKLEIDEMIEEWKKTLNKVHPIKEDILGVIKNLNFSTSSKRYTGVKTPKPKVFIPVFPGTNCEYDSIRAFEKAGADISTLVFKNLSASDIQESLKLMAKEILNSQILMMPGGFSAGDEPDGAGKFIATIFRNPYISQSVMELLNKRDGLILGICNGFQALIKLGLVPYGEIRLLDKNSPTLTYNKIGRHISRMSNTKVVSNLSPWLNKTNLDDVHTIPMSHGEGRFVAGEYMLDQLIKSGQIATQYVDYNGNATYDGLYNPNGSVYAVEGITSPDGRVFGKMGHSERICKDIYKNIPGNKDQGIFCAGVEYFK
ncbi:phosphoribosylformylglycinamidine synthase [Alkalibaculum sp. M08DMB]|uniref:Phosphoribosylformylglycinamidine synthase n=1 Tax=Alkalibaculum sporogenes TaxID=2655001 RepID=A0A6A7K763_9FIRM|nr:phosphoribosylformylglycinamidine synthase [Alkalibaculum sporogenes]MPW24963.1 phosphoribosylformylglycinamidine synthase [Alkalibaculum sporogenes]